MRYVTARNGREREARRRVLVAIAVATGLVSLIAAVAAGTSLGTGAVTLLLVLASGAAFGFAALIAVGRGDWLTDDEQLLWLTER